MTLPARELDAVEFHGPGARSHDSHQALQCRALAGAIAAQQRYDLVALDVQRDVEQNVRIAVIAIETADFEQAHARPLRALASRAALMRPPVLRGFRRDRPPGPWRCP